MSDEIQPQTTPVSPATAVQTEPISLSESKMTIDPVLVQAAAAEVIAKVKPVAEAAAAETATNILDEFKKSKFGSRVVGFFDSAIGKSVQTLLWTGGAYLLTLLGAHLTDVHFGDKWVALGVPGLLNWAFYTAKVLVDSKVPNLPTRSK